MIVGWQQEYGVGGSGGVIEMVAIKGTTAVADEVVGGSGDVDGLKEEAEGRVREDVGSEVKGEYRRGAHLREGHYRGNGIRG